jgi:hypothetical protein
MALGAALTLGGPRVQACSMQWAPVYAFTRLPGPSRQEFLTGKLGLISGKWDDATLLVAFRYLEGLPMSASSQAAFAEVGEATTVASPRATGLSLWQNAVARAGRAAAPNWIQQDREDRDPRGYYAYYPNCLDNALLTAAKTLDERVARYGRGSREVGAWLEGQQTVFENCARGEREPRELDATFDARLRADRSYQRAAAAFYAGRLDVAEERFKAIAMDSTSEWSGLASYLVARAQIRAGRLAEADMSLRSVLARPALDRWHASARGLLSYVAARLRPEERAAELAERLFGRELAVPLRQDLEDYLSLIRSDTPARNPRDQEFREWLKSLRADSDIENERAVARFLERPSSLARLIAALGARAADPSADERILHAAEGVSPSAPAYLAVSYGRALRLSETGRYEDARTVLDNLLASPASLSVSDRNAFRKLRAAVAETLAEFVDFMLVPRVGDAWDRYESPLAHPLPHDPSTDELPTEALYVLNNGVPLEGWMNLATSESVPAHWRRLLALSGFARAIVDGADDIAPLLARQALALDPRVADDLQTYLEARNADERRFAAAMVLLRRAAVGYNLGLRFDSSEDSELSRGDWWCGGTEMTAETLNYRPHFLGNGQSLVPHVPAQPAAEFLGDLVLAYASRHADDSRVPEALHRVVRVTRLGCRLGENGRISHAAFSLLHRRYRTSEWTNRTRYWFN